MASEDEFMKQALQFLEEIGVDTASVQAATNLFDNDLLDSLGTLAFLDFLEQQAGQEIEIDNLDVRDIATLRDAYQFVTSRQG